jgi:hypothetical protein
MTALRRMVLAIGGLAAGGGSAAEDASYLGCNIIKIRDHKSLKFMPSEYDLVRFYNGLNYLVSREDPTGNHLDVTEKLRKRGIRDQICEQQIIYC